MSRHASAAPTLARVLGVWLVLASVAAEAQDAPAAPTVQPTPPPSTDSTLEAPVPETVPIDEHGEMTLEGGIAALKADGAEHAGLDWRVYAARFALCRLQRHRAPFARNQPHRRRPGRSASRSSTRPARSWAQSPGSCSLS